MVGVYVSDLKTFVQKSVVKNLVSESLSMVKWEARYEVQEEAGTHTTLRFH